MKLDPLQVERAAEILGSCVQDGRRSLLLVDLPRRVSLQLPDHKVPMDQVRADLHTLAGLAIGDQPAATPYLEAGARLLGEHDPKSALLVAMANRLRRGPCRVILMNPRAPTRWHQKHAAAECDVIEGPDGMWHIENPPGADPWSKAREAIDHAIDGIAQRAGDIHVYASTAYALAAYLGNRVGNLPGVRAHFWQPGRDRWADYGPGDRGDIDPEPLLTQVAEHPGDPAHVALLCSITHALVLDEVAHGLALAGAADATRVDLATPTLGHTALPDRAAVDRAARDLRGAIDAALRRPGVRAVHLFYAGPAALLMRTADKLHLAAPRVVIHERGPGNRYRPALAFDRGRAELITADR